MDILNVSFTQKITHLSKLLTGCVLTLGILVLIGWQFNISVLKSVLPNLVAMNPMTSVGLMASSATVLFLNKKSKRNYIFIILASIPLGIGALELSDTFFHSSIEIDKLLFAEKLDNQVINGAANSMALNTAFNMLLTGIALLMIRIVIKEKYFPSQFIAVAIGFVSLLSIIGYIYHVKAFYGALSHIPMAVHTAVGFLLISLIILFEHPESKLMLVISSDYEGSNVARILIPAAIIVPILLGYLRLLGQWHGIYSVEFGGALLVITIIMAFLILIYFNSKILNNRDKLRRKTTEQINELNNQLTKINKQLTDVNNELESFSYSVSHDLKAPLRAVIGYANILEEDYGNVLNKDGQLLLKTVVENGKKMNRLIDDLLAFSKLERAELKKDNVNIREMIEAIWSDLNMSSPSQALLKISEVHNVQADQSLLQQVLINLISNAIKYSSKKKQPVVSINSQIKGNEIEYSISDNGVGFDMQYAQKLFSVFHRLHGADFEGTGVGLAIVQRIINKHRGRVWASAKPDEGATFYFTLPAA